MPDRCVVDTSCLIVLDKAALLPLLCELYEKVYVLKSVIVEFGVSPFISCAEVVDVRSKLIMVLTEELNLGLGEAETIAYAYEEGIRAIIDDAKARRVAEKLSIKLTGTLGLLIKAEERRIIESSYKTVLELRRLGFRISDGLIEELKMKKEKS
jgi:predicted nucleic acid-binding protein